MSKRRFTEDSFMKEPWFRALCSAMVECKDEQDMANFLRDIATLSELQAWSERLEVAKLLAQGLTYRDIALKTGASTTTVTRVAKFLENGQGGYRKVLNAHRHHRTVHTTEKAPASQSRATSVLQKYLDRSKE